jgi:hypothetical protein
MKNCSAPQAGVDQRFVPLRIKLRMPSHGPCARSSAIRAEYLCKRSCSKPGGFSVLTGIGARPHPPRESATRDLQTPRHDRLLSIRTVFPRQGARSGMTISARSTRVMMSSIMHSWAPTRTRRITAGSSMRCSSIPRHVRRVSNQRIIPTFIV